jgi:predicted transcriptional regulator
MNIGEICQHDVITAHASDEIVAAARLMRDKHVGYVVIVEPRVAAQSVAPIGVLTDRDIVVEVVARGVDARTARVDQVMTRNPLLVPDSEQAEQALREMRRRGVRRAPVVGSQGQLVGVVALDDLLSVLAGELQDVAWSIERGQEREQALRR